MKVEIEVGKPVEVKDVVIPDLWHIGQMMESDMRYSLHAKAVLDCWAMAHAFKRALVALESGNGKRCMVCGWKGGKHEPTCPER